VKPYYEQDGITIYHGDLLEVLPQLPRVQLVVTDPPYGINTKSDGSGKINPWADLCNSAYWYAAWFKAVRSRLEHDGAMWSFLNWRSQVTFQKASCDESWPIESLLVWDKEWIGPGGQRGLRPSYELVALFPMPEFAVPNRGVPDIKRSQWSSQKPNGHPAEKPVDLVSWIISTSGGDGVVLDTFMGSGTTLVAAKNLHRQAVGIEIEERYCEIAAKRLRQAVLFSASGDVQAAPSLTAATPDGQTESLFL
jgi:site-specific DNA-methyltransferase (adenine-specific)